MINKKKKIKVCVVGDTHRQHWSIKVPKCDIFIFVGDAEIDSLLALHDFNDWLGNIKVKYGRIVICGNHDIECERIGKAWCKQLFTNAIYLENEGIEIAGLKIWGNPYTPEFMSWAYMKPRGSRDLKDIWEQVPENLDILIGHGMPYQILDWSNYEKKNVGCEVLQRVVFKKKPRYYLGGHLHEAHGKLEKEGIQFYNVSVLDGEYNLVHEPTIIEI